MSDKEKIILKLDKSLEDSEDFFTDKELIQSFRLIDWGDGFYIHPKDLFTSIIKKLDTSKRRQEISFIDFKIFVKEEISWKHIKPCLEEIESIQGGYKIGILAREKENRELIKYIMENAPIIKVYDSFFVVI